MERTELLRLLITHNAFLDTKDLFGVTPLHCTIPLNMKKNLEILVMNGANVNERCNERITPLHVSVLWEYDDVSLFLLKTGASMIAKDSLDVTPIEDALVERRLCGLKIMINFSHRLEL